MFSGVVLKSIVFLSNNRKKALLEQFCLAYKHILSKYHLFATYTTSCVVKSLGLAVTPLLSAKVGGVRQVISGISSHQFDLVLFFFVICFVKPDFSGKLCIENEIFYACDAHSVPYATNILMAEVLLRALDSGEFF